ncbi:M23 family metallopeptidase [Streptomyces sp. NPDC001941]|uniref:M23 family metallopeptidase n=1 Tax=Streptomyces sp. NPDC001941 TaxID=3154659 RepID=UPI00331CB1F0
MFFSPRRRSLLVVPAVCALTVLGPLPRPAAADDGPAVGTEVARLYEQASRATAAYERGRRAAAVQREHARSLQVRLAAERRELARLHDRAGDVARAQYRTGSGLVLTAELLLADDPDALLRARRLAWQTETAVNRLTAATRDAEERLGRAEAGARSAWHDLEERQARLARLRRGIETRLAGARQRLQDEARRSVTAGRCRGAVRLRQPGGVPRGRAWVPPVEGYALSAGFDSAGAHWAHRHTGQDFAVSIGTPVRAIGAGRVVSVSCGGGFGIEVVVLHPNGWYSQYAHLSAAGVDQGEAVLPGQWIGQAGTTGNSTGPHLHFEVRLTPYLGSGVDPVPWLREHGVGL